MTAPTTTEGSAAIMADLLASFTGHKLTALPTAGNGGGELPERALRPGFGDWLESAARAHGCTRPIRLRGSSLTVEKDTGRVLSSFDTDTLPDGVLYTACKNRRATVCPACAHTYRYDTYHLIAAGLRGGKGITETVADHPAVLATFTAPSFGTVHSAPSHAHQPGYRCRPRRDDPTCPHGRSLTCYKIHRHDDPIVGQPFCLDCYDHDHQVVWNHFVPRLWDRTMTAIRRNLTHTGRSLGLPFVLAGTYLDAKGKARNRWAPPVKISYAKVGEYQRRGVIHLHALIRIDGYQPASSTTITPPPDAITVDHLTKAITDAAASTALRTPAHPLNPEGWPLTWGNPAGRHHVDVRVIRRGLPGVELTEQHVAGYIAKYVTKGTEATGINTGRLTDGTARALADPATHTGRLIEACWRLGRPTRLARPSLDHAYTGLRKWAHMLGFGGHITTKSRRYSTTLGALRAARRASHTPTTGPTTADPTELHAEQADTETTLVINDWTYVGTGWLTSTDAALALAAANAARSRRPGSTTEHAA